MAAEDLKETIEPEGYTELLPPEGNPAVGYKVFEFLSEILKNKEDLSLPETWNRYYQLRRNKHWQINPGADQSVSLVSANLLGSHHSKTVNSLTDNNPTFDVTQVGEIPEDAREVLDTIIRLADHWWRDQEQQSVLEESVHTGETYGCVAEKVHFDPEIEFGEGEIETVSIDPFYFGMWPITCRRVQKSQAVFYYYPMDIREAQSKWPEFAKDIKADEEIIESLGDLRHEVVAGQEKSSRQGVLTTLAGVFRNLVSSKKGGGTNATQTVVCECWVKDNTADGENLKYYGGIRRVIALNGGEIVVSDVNNPSINPKLPIEDVIRSYLFDKFPFSFTPSVIDPASPWGMADFEQLSGLNTEFNKSLSQLTLYKDKASRLKLINPRDSGVENHELDDYPGIINPANNMVAQGIRYLENPKMPADLTATLEIYKDIFFLIAGTFDLESAQTPGREVIAYKAIAALLENAHRQLRNKIRNYSKMIRQRGRMYISLAQSWYGEEKWISYSEDGEHQAVPVQMARIRVPAKLTVVSGSTMPKSKVQQREEALALADKGAIDQIALLQAMDFPNWRDVVKRMQAGPYGILFEMLAQLGTPPELIEYFQMISQTDPDKLKKVVESGELPTFPQVMQHLMAKAQGQEPQLPPEQQIEMAQAQIEMAEIQAKIEKLNAETDLIQEKQVTERLEQHVKLEGLDFDKQMMVIKRAEAVSGIQQRTADTAIKAQDSDERAITDERKDTIKAAEVSVKEKQVRAAENKPGYNEKGMKSNNKE